MSDQLTSEQCREHLKAVIDPEIYQNIVDLGLVYGTEVKSDNAVDVTMTLTTPHCPMGPQIMEDVEKTLKGKGATAVNINLVWEPMWTPDAMTEELKHELGLIEEEPELISEPVTPIVELPPPPPKKRGFLSRLFGMSS